MHNNGVSIEFLMTAFISKICVIILRNAQQSTEIRCSFDTINGLGAPIKNVLILN